MHFDNGVVKETEINVAPNDIVNVTCYGGTYSTYTNAMQQLWGGKHHGFCGDRHEKYADGLYGSANLEREVFHEPSTFWKKKKWRVLSVALHESTTPLQFEPTLICAIQDRLGRKLVISIRSLKTVKRNPKNNQLVNIYQIHRQNDRN